MTRSCDRNSEIPQVSRDYLIIIPHYNQFGGGKVKVASDESHDLAVMLSESESRTRK